MTPPHTPPPTDGGATGTSRGHDEGVDAPGAVEALTARLRPLSFVTDLLVGGSAATGDYRPGISDLDLVALTDRPLDGRLLADVVALHRELDSTTAAGARLGCAYVDAATLTDLHARHPTWTHGTLVERPLSGIVRAELVRQGHAVLGRPPEQVLPPMSDDDVRRAAQDELTGYWSAAARHPWWWLDTSFVDLSLTSMARGRHAMAAGRLLTKTASIDLAHAPAWLRRDIRARRDGQPLRSPRVRGAWYGWRDAGRTTAAARRQRRPD